jgi:hypothetical protein
MAFNAFDLDISTKTNINILIPSSLLHCTTVIYLEGAEGESIINETYRNYPNKTTLLEIF